MAMQNVAAMMLGMQGSKAQSAANQNEQQGAPGTATAGASEGQQVLSDRASAFQGWSRMMGLDPSKKKKSRGSILGGLGGAMGPAAGTILGGAQAAGQTAKRFGIF